MSRLHVAILDEELPYPLTSGKRIRTFNLLKRLAKSHRVTYIAHRNADADEVRPAARALRHCDIFPVVVDYRIPPKSGPGFYARLLGNLASPLPYSVTTHASRAMQHALDRLLATDPPDLWHCEWTPYAHAMYGRSGAWVVMAHNVESIIWQRLMEAESNLLKRWFIRHQWRKFKPFEAWAYSAATRAIAVSHEDAERMKQQFGARNVAVVDNGVDTAFFRPDPATIRDPHRILFLGSLDWRPNLDGVRLLLDDVFPTLQAAEPRSTLAIVGRRPPDWLRHAVKDRPGIELHADVPDVRPYIHGAGVLAVPLRVGGGSRLKILEALAAGLPVVTTTVGVEGLRLRPDDHCTIVDGMEQFAATLIDVVARTEAMREQAARGRERVLAEYDWDRLANQMDQVWQQAVEKETPLTAAGVMA